MEHHQLHRWDVEPTQAVQIQKELRDKVRLQPYDGEVRLVAGADVSFGRYSPVIYACFVVLEAPDWKVVSAAYARKEMDFPYVPGLLSFREIPPLLEAWKKLEIDPDMIVFDGQGIAHPRRLGIASHMGLLLNKPTIGCAKSLLVGEFVEPGEKRGAWNPLTDRGEQVGVVLRTKDRTNPVFVSPGHLMDFESSVRILMSTVRHYRVPEPTRQAHLLVNEYRLRH